MDTSEMRGLRLTIYTDGRDYSNGGISSRCREVCVVGTVNELSGKRAAVQMFTVRDMVGDRPRPYVAVGGHPEVPAVVVVRRRMGREILLHVEPLTEPEERTGTPWMSGGSYVGTSDSRLRRLIGEGAFYGALALHDRTETWAQYNALST